MAIRRGVGSKEVPALAWASWRSLLLGAFVPDLLEVPGEGQGPVGLFSVHVKPFLGPGVISDRSASLAHPLDGTGSRRADTERWRKLGPAAGRLGGRRNMDRMAR